MIPETAAVYALGAAGTAGRMETAGEAVRVTAAEEAVRAEAAGTAGRMTGGTTETAISVMKRADGTAGNIAEIGIVRQRTVMTGTDSVVMGKTVRRDFQRSGMCAVTAVCADGKTAARVRKSAAGSPEEKGNNNTNALRHIKLCRRVMGREGMHEDWNGI